jgi:predicted permease
VLVVAQMTLALLLLIGAGLMMKSFARMRTLDPGFDPRNLLAVAVPLTDPAQAIPGRKTTSADLERRRAVYEAVTARIGALPGIAEVSAINHLPIVGDLWSRDFFLEGQPPPPPGDEMNAVYRIVAPHYVDAMGLTLLAGRDLTHRDNVGAPGVVLINEAFARATWPGGNPIGQRIRVEDGGPNPREVIGVVADAKQRDWTAPARPEMYLAYLQNPRPDTMAFVVRTTGAAPAVARMLTDEIAAVDRDRPAPKVLALAQVVDDAMGGPRFNLTLLNLFAALALILAAVGVYGVMAHVVSRKTHEIGIRLALGAQIAQVRRMIVGHGMGLTAIGVVLGLLCALAATRLITTLLFEVSPTDPGVFAALSLLLALVALLACYLPARRATRTDPMSALRQE